MRREDIRNVPWPIWATTTQSVALSMMLALAFFLSGDERVSGSAYTGVVATGGADTWGMVFLLVALFLATATWQMPTKLVWGFVISSVAYGSLAATFLVSALIHSTANLTAPVAYGWLSWVHGFIAWRLLKKCRGKSPTVV